MKKVMLLASKDMCDILRRELNDKYITLPCYDPAAGAALLQTTPDALILELPLPEISGMTFLRDNKSSLPPVILVLTPYISDIFMKEMEAIGVTAVILMPFRSSFLQKTLALHVETKCPSR